MPPTATALQVTDLDLGDVAPNPRNLRRDVGDVTDLVESIRQLGVLEPLLVAPNPHADGPPFVLIAGHRRYAAAQVAVLASVPCIVRADLTTDADITLAMLTENLQRVDLSPIEEATGYAQLELAGMKPAEIARRTGRARSTVEARLRLLDLPESVRDRVHAHQVTLDEAAVLGEFAGDKAAAKRLEKALGTNNWSWTVESERRSAERARQIAAVRDRIVRRGHRVVDLGYDSWQIGTREHLDVERLHRLGYAPVWAPGGSPVDPDELVDEDSPDASWPEHESCPGHAAAGVQPGSVIWVCTTNVAEHRAAYEAAVAAAPDYEPGRRHVPDAGGYTRPTATVSPEQAERAAARERELAEARARSEALATAQTVRQAWFRPLLTGAKPLPKAQTETVVRFGVTTLTGDVDSRVDPASLLLLLGIDIEDIDEDDLEERAALELQARDPHRALLASLAAAAEDDLDRVHAWTNSWNRPYVLAWLRCLTTLGYTPSDVEAELLAEPKPADVEDEDDEDPEDDEPRAVEDVPTGDLL